MEPCSQSEHLDLRDPIIFIFHLTQPVCMLTFIVVFQSHCQPAYTSDACRTLTQGVSAGTAAAGESKSHLYGVEGFQLVDQSIPLSTLV